MNIPGNIYLCQVNEHVSCGACCGLYNLPGVSAEAVCCLLNARTAAFSKVAREMAAILAFGEAESARLAGRHPLPEFHHCPYLGLIGPRKRTVGCLLHPLSEENRGIDYRGLSYYGSMTCNMYFCPTHHQLPDDFKQLLKTVAGDWYHYGLVITETDLLEAFHAQILIRNGGVAIDPEKAAAIGSRPLWEALFALKRDWPFARPERPLAHYFFNDRLYPKPDVDYAMTGKPGSRYDPIFRELHSVFSSADEQARAEAYLDLLFDRIAESLAVQRG